MARKRIEGSQFQSWDDVDHALQQIGEIDRELTVLEAAHNESIDQLKASAKAQAEPLLAKKAALELAMKDFAESNRAEFAKVKSRQMTWGTVSFRLSTKVLVKKVGDTLQALKDLGLHGCIRIKEEIDKEALKNLDEETLTTIGAALRPENVFGYEINRHELVEA
ncbi:host-nuclease inhibitor Gam family protein [Chitinimonas sp.]|uniref:host-nuclease inhibitor Gam family protein n=1 Tax=Chitinimonas sp. TaxID=1934313 RepID=UPI0035B3E220